jgi:hypothetical protein
MEKHVFYPPMQKTIGFARGASLNIILDLDKFK